MHVCILSVQNIDYLALVIDITFKTTYRVCLVALYLFHNLTINSRPSCVIPNSEITLPPCLRFLRDKSIKFESGFFTLRVIKIRSQARKLFRMTDIILCFLITVSVVG